MMYMYTYMCICICINVRNTDSPLAFELDISRTKRTSQRCTRNARCPSASPWATRGHRFQR